MATVSPPLVSAAPPNCTPPYYMKMEELWVIMASLPDIAAVTGEYSSVTHCNGMHCSCHCCTDMFRFVKFAAIR
jgi:hypothetical protein